MQPNLIKLKESYDNAEREADAFRKALEDQISDLLSQNSLPIAIPIESRTKKWSSILVKLDRLAESWEDVSQIWDLVGLRIVFLFPEEVAGACGLIERNFEIVYRENTSQRLSSNEFGYQSIHFVVRLLPSWLKVPTLRNHNNFQAEIQVRTLSQHNWAIASRLLQYNNESFAPPSVQRSMFRVAALLELVDLELDRIQKQRDDYKKQVSTGGYNQTLNIDLLGAILNTYLPASHRVPKDDYSGLLSDLTRCKVLEGTQVIALIDKHLGQALVNDKMAINEIRLGNSPYENDPASLEKGVFYSHVGLMQNILNLEFGLDWRKIKNRVD